MLSRLREDFFPRKQIGRLQQFKYRIVYPVKMPLCIRTVLRVALQFYLWKVRLRIILIRSLLLDCSISAQTQLLFRRQLDDLRLIPLLS